MFIPNFLLFSNLILRLEFTGAVQGLTRIDIHLESGHLLGSSNDCAVRLWSIDDQRMRVIINFSKIIFFFFKGCIYWPYR